MAAGEDVKWTGSMKDHYACVLHDKDGVVKDCIVTTLAECQRRARVGKLDYTFTLERMCTSFKVSAKLADLTFEKRKDGD